MLSTVWLKNEYAVEFYIIPQQQSSSPMWSAKIRTLMKDYQPIRGWYSFILKAVLPKKKTSTPVIEKCQIDFIIANYRSTPLTHLIARPPHEPPAILFCTPGLASTPLSCGMASCWQINSILANSGRKNSIQILNQYPFLRKVLIWAQFIGFIKFLSF